MALWKKKTPTDAVPATGPAPVPPVQPPAGDTTPAPAARKWWHRKKKSAAPADAMPVAGPAPEAPEQDQLVSPFEYGDKAFTLEELPNDARMRDKAWHQVKAVTLNIMYFEWTKMLVHWLIRVAGTMSECAFLVAGLWMSLNANVHPLIRESLSEKQTIDFTYYATSAYVALPELIVGLAVMVTVSHIRLAIMTKGLTRVIEVIWTIFYGIPAIIFVGLSIFTISHAVADGTFTLDTNWRVIRADAGYTYAFVSVIYSFVGKPMMADLLRKKDRLLAKLREETKAAIARLKIEKDGKIAELEAETTRLHALLQSETTRLTGLLEVQRGETRAAKRQQDELMHAMNKASEGGLQAYGEACIAWLKSGIKSATVPDITRYTGLTTAKVNNAIKRGELKGTPNNKDLILLSSLVPWLQSLPGLTARTEQETEKIPVLFQNFAPDLMVTSNGHNHA